MSSVISVRVSTEEQEALRRASRLYGCGVPSLIKRLAFEKPEDEYNLQVVKAYEEKKAAGTLKTRSIEELWADLHL